MEKTMGYSAISIELTKRCNLLCRYCYAGTEQGSRAFIDYERLCGFLESFVGSGGRKVLLTGGELFLHDRVLDIIKYASRLGLIVDIFTNGTLVTDAHIDVIGKRVNQVFLSLDGPQSVQDRLSGTPGSFDRVRETAVKFAGSGVATNLQSMIVPENLNDFGWLLDILGSVDIRTVVLSHVSRMGKGTEVPELLLDDGQMLHLLRRSAELMKCSGYKTRIVTNIVTSDMRRVFYGDFVDFIHPWMMPDGTIYTCYNTSLGYWKLSDYVRYPAVEPYAADRLRCLNERLVEQTEHMPFFDLFQMIHVVSEDMAREGDAHDGV